MRIDVAGEPLLARAVGHLHEEPRAVADDARTIVSPGSILSPQVLTGSAGTSSYQT